MVNNLFNLDLVREKKNIESYIGVANFQKVENHFNNKASLKSIFHSNEINQFNSFPSEARKKSFFLGRYAAKIGLRKFLSNYELNQFEIKTGVFNRPIPFYHFPTTIFPEVTITHSHDLALAIAYDHEHVIGIDLEHIPQIKAEYILKVINPSEKVFINQVEHIAVLWTIKEALSKALRCGLTVPFELFEIKKMEIMNNGVYLNYFKNFNQYKCYTKVIDNYSFSIVIPKFSDLNFDFKLLENSFATYST